MNGRMAKALDRISSAVTAIRVRDEEADRATRHDEGMAERQQAKVEKLEAIADRLEEALA